MEGKLAFNKVRAKAPTLAFAALIFSYYDCKWLSVPLRGRPESVETSKEVRLVLVC